MGWLSLGLAGQKIPFPFHSDKCAKNGDQKGLAGSEIIKDFP
jgi:hypothetical protein